MKLKINETVEREIEVEFPLFTGDGKRFCKIIDEKTVITVYCSSDTSYGLNRFDSFVPSDWMLLPKVTEERFNSEYKKVAELINKEL